MTFTPSTRYCPVRHSPSFAIPQLSPKGNFTETSEVRFFFLFSPQFFKCQNKLDSNSMNLFICIKVNSDGLAPRLTSHFKIIHDKHDIDFSLSNFDKILAFIKITFSHIHFYVLNIIFIFIYVNSRIRPPTLLALKSSLKLTGKPNTILLGREISSQLTTRNGRLICNKIFLFFIFFWVGVINWLHGFCIMYMIYKHCICNVFLLVTTFATLFVIFLVIFFNLSWFLWFFF